MNYIVIDEISIITEKKDIKLTHYKAVVEAAQYFLDNFAHARPAVIADARDKLKQAIADIMNYIVIDETSIITKEQFMFLLDRRKPVNSEKEEVPTDWYDATNGAMIGLVGLILILAFVIVGISLWHIVPFVFNLF